MANNSLITQEQMQSDLEQFYSQKVYPYLNGSANLGFTPIGTVISVMSNEAPDNYLVCDGTAYNISEYSDLANFFEDQFGSKNYFGGNGTTTFAVPDLRGEFLRGTGTNSHTDQGSGSNVGVHQDGTEIPMIGGNKTNNIIAVRSTNGSDTWNTVNKADKSLVSTTPNYDMQFNRDTMYTNVSYATYFTSRPTNTSVLYCIAYKNIYFQQMHDYSTTEHVVGTWIGGEPLYEKVIEITSLPNATSEEYSHNISNLKNILFYDGIVPFNSGACLEMNGNYSDSNLNISLRITGTTIVIECLTNRSAQTGYVKLRYTKTTD